MLSRLIVEIARHPLLGQELVFRGGTCLHKLWLDRPWRYSEDLDYVRRSGGGIGGVLDAIREIAQAVGFDNVQTETRTQHPKARLRAQYEGGGPFRIKVEINTFERSPAQPIVTRPSVVDSPWFQGEADVQTSCAPELIATKIRALYQRSKGRDLFDIWLAVDHLRLDPAEIAACFEIYRPAGWTTDLAKTNLDEKFADGAFVTDLDQLIAEWPQDYTTGAGHRAVLSILEAIEARSPS
ncbi:nucleotidyl transferase AbiEii/AbiGii toxin family protein [Candidatus Poriferisodalis sp.]|uniref:nucleotidyl transferase AbiEii/AbiGii toxin family protein n=1 Tax=Candidatus Poriferisodalis sp. TaxID=3101277 RepID=UPI003B029229